MISWFFILNTIITKGPTNITEYLVETKTDQSS